MAVRLKDVVEEMRATVARNGLTPAARADRVFDLAADFLVTALARESLGGQTSILMVVPELEQLAFVYPRHLARGNVLPIDRNSFAGRVVLDREVLIENSVPTEPHKDFFERIPGPSGRVRPIQTLIAAPLPDREGAVLGVIEVSRTGERAGRAHDFTARDAANLEKSCRVFAPFIVHTWTRARSR